MVIFSKSEIYLEKSNLYINNCQLWSCSSEGCRKRMIWRMNDTWSEGISGYLPSFEGTSRRNQIVVAEFSNQSPFANDYGAQRFQHFLQRHDRILTLHNGCLSILFLCVSSELLLIHVLYVCAYDTLRLYGRPFFGIVKMTRDTKILKKIWLFNY